MSSTADKYLFNSDFFDKNLNEKLQFYTINQPNLYFLLPCVVTLLAPQKIQNVSKTDFSLTYNLLVAKYN